MRGWEIGGQPNLQTGEEVFWSFAPENAYMDERDSRQDEDEWRIWRLHDPETDFFLMSAP